MRLFFPLFIACGICACSASAQVVGNNSRVTGVFLQPTFAQSAFEKPAFAAQAAMEKPVFAQATFEKPAFAVDNAYIKPTFASSTFEKAAFVPPFGAVVAAPAKAATPAKASPTKTPTTQVQPGIGLELPPPSIRDMLNQ